MQNSRPSLAVVMPVYNEVAVIEEAVRDVCSNVLDKVAGSILLAVDDGSTDGTDAVLDALAKADPRRLMVIHKKNSGHGSAVIEGVNRATADFILQIDSDQQISLEDFAQAWQRIPAIDAVFGVRRRRQDPVSRLILSRFVHALIALFFGVHLRDVNCPFKIFRRSIYTDLQPYISEQTLIPSIFIGVFAVKRGHAYQEFPVTHSPRKNGFSKIRHFKLLKFCVRAFGQLWQFRQQLAQ